MSLPATKTVEYRWSPKTISQYEAMNDKHPDLLCSGPWFSGKSHVGAAKAVLLGHIFERNCIALVRKKRVDLKATLWKWFVDKVLPPQMVIAKNDTDLYRQIGNGTEFFGVGLDSDTDVNKLASREYGMIVVEEAREIDEEDYDTKLSRCLRLPTVPFHQLMLLTNPDAPAHFLYQRFYVEKRPGYRVIDMEMLPNPPASYQQRLDQLTGIFKDRYKLGKWTAAVGLVYPFDPGRHIITEYHGVTKDTIPQDWKRVISVDFGFDHPFVAQWWAITPSDVWLLYRQIYMTRRRVEIHAKEIEKYCAIDRIYPQAICDHDAENRATLEHHGIATIAANKDRLAGQQSVYEKFENDQIFMFQHSLIEEDQRLVMERKPTGTGAEFAGYVWASKAKEDMIKQNDDGMDAMRYAIHTTLNPKDKAEIWSLS